MTKKSRYYLFHNAISDRHAYRQHAQDAPLICSFQGVISQPFRPRAGVLQLLGDKLIGSAHHAVFELVKNVYETDANEVSFILDLASAQEPSITITDDSESTKHDVFRSGWLVPGDFPQDLKPCH